MTATNENMILVKEIEQNIESSLSSVDAHKAYVEARAKIEEVRKQISQEIQTKEQNLKGLLEQKKVWDQLLLEITSLAGKRGLQKIDYDTLKQLVAGYLLPYLINNGVIGNSKSDNFFSTVFPEKITEMTEKNYEMLQRVKGKISEAITNIKNQINECEYELSQMRQRLFALGQVTEKIHGACLERFHETFSRLDTQYAMIHDTLPRTESFQLPPMSNDPNDFIYLDYVVLDPNTQVSVAAALSDAGFSTEELAYLQETIYSIPALDVGVIGIRHAQETSGDFPDYVISFPDTPEDVRQSGGQVKTYRIPRSAVFDWKSWAEKYIDFLEKEIEEKSRWSDNPQEISRLKEEKAKCEKGCREQRYIVLGYLRPEWERKDT